MWDDLAKISDTKNKSSELKMADQASCNVEACFFLFSAET